MFGKNFDFLTDWAVSGVSLVYKLLVQNLYFILSNGLFLLCLFFLRFTVNNLIFFVVPIFFLLVSISAQFAYPDQTEDVLSFKQYVQMYRALFKRNVKIFLFYTVAILFLVIDFKILFLAKNILMVYALALTGCFLLSGMLFVLFVITDERANTLSLGKKLIWSVVISFRLPVVTMVNVFVALFLIFCMQNFSLAYLCFFGGTINYFIRKNLSRRFSVALFYEQIAEKGLNG